MLILLINSYLPLVNLDVYTPGPKGQLIQFTIWLYPCHSSPFGCDPYNVHHTRQLLSSRALMKKSRPSEKC